MTQERKKEYTLRITQANKTQMITILYEMVTIYLSEAIDHIEAGETAEADRSLMSAQSCIDELIHSVNLDYELGRNLYEIYIFSKKELMAAGARGDAGRIKRGQQGDKRADKKDCSAAWISSQCCSSGP